MLKSKNSRDLNNQESVKFLELQGLPLNLRCYFRHCLESESKGEQFSCDQQCRGRGVGRSERAKGGESGSNEV